MNILANLYG